MTIGTITPELRRRFKLASGVKGVVVMQVVPGSEPAEKGVRPGDVILEVTMRKVANPADVAKWIADERKAGKPNILLLIQRGKDARFVPLTLKSN